MYTKISLILVIIILISFPIFAEEIQNIELHTSNTQNFNKQTDNTSYSLTADGGISYDNKQGVLVALDNARFQIDDILIIAAEIAVYYEDSIVRAVGEQLSIQVGEQIYKGVSLNLNYQTMTGSISGVSSKINDLTVSGREITLTETNEYEIEGVELTPCVLEDPHYSLKAKEITVYPEDKIVAKGVWFYFYGNRIFYVPVYTVRFNQTTGTYDSISFFPSLAYNSNDGIHLELAYPYEISDKLQGVISGEIDQYGDKYFKMENTYRVNSKLELINSYLYQDEEDDDGDIEKNNELSGGLHYRNNGFDMYSLFKRDYLIDKNIIELDTRYKYEKYDFRYYNMFTASDLSNEIYSIRYKSSSPLQLLYKKGYDIDYLPYLSLENLKYSYSGIDVNSSIGIGKVANKAIVSNKARLDLKVDNEFLINEKLKFDIYGQLESNYYINDDNGDSISKEYYNHYLLGFSAKMNSNINNRLNIGYRLAYEYSWETGQAYLPEDKNDVEEIINPALGISYRLSEFESLKFDLDASYELNNKDLEEFNIKFTRQFDCYSYYLGYDIVDEVFELGVNF